MTESRSSAGPSRALIDMLVQAVEFAAALAREYARNVTTARDDATREEVWAAHESYVRHAVPSVMRRCGLPAEATLDYAAVYLAVDDLVHLSDVLHRRLLIGDVVSWMSSTGRHCFPSAGGLIPKPSLQPEPVFFSMR